MGCQRYSNYYSRIEPIQKSLASHISRVGRVGLKTLRTGAELRHFFNKANDFSYSEFHAKSTFFLVKEVRGEAISEKRAINLR